MDMEVNALIHSDSMVSKQSPQPVIMNGLTAFTAAVFIVGEMAGSGVLALPEALVNTGWIGILLLCMLGIFSGICGIVLGESWMILRRDFGEYQGHVRHPYPALGYHAFGKAGKYTVVGCVNATLIGACTVFLLLASENFHDLIPFHSDSISPKNEYRIWLVICILSLLPLTWLGTPKNFWPVALIAILATTIACVLISVKLGVELGETPPTRKVTISSFCAAFGAIAFSFGGTATFPTIQTDMKQPGRFHIAVMLAYTCVLLLYLPVSTLGYFTFGDKVKPNILLNLSAGSIVTKCVEALVGCHLLFSFVIAINPISQQLEEWLNIPKGKLTVKRCLVRTALVFFILGLAEGIPHFSLFLSLVGSSTTCLLTFVFPCLFYLRLADKLSLHMKVLMVEIAVVGSLAGITSTYFAIKAIIEQLA